MMILRNHGLLVHGKSIPEAFVIHNRLNRACEVAVAQSSIDDGLLVPRPIIDSFAAAEHRTSTSLETLILPASHYRRTFDAMVRLLDKKDTSYKY
jgi:ribulose-5-phosphate 4-epimerase/fuculose-1-phosphate aldolase